MVQSSEVTGPWQKMWRRCISRSARHCASCTRVAVTTCPGGSRGRSSLNDGLDELSGLLCVPGRLACASACVNIRIGRDFHEPAHVMREERGGAGMRFTRAQLLQTIGGQAGSVWACVHLNFILCAVQQTFAQLHCCGSSFHAVCGPLYMSAVLEKTAHDQQSVSRLMTA